MLFYKAEVTLKSESTASKRDNPDEYDMFVSEMKENSQSFFRKSGENFFFFISRLNKTRLTVGSILKKAINRAQDGNIAEQLNSYLKMADIVFDTMRFEEITLQALSSMLSSAERCGFIADDTDVLDMFNLMGISRYRHGFSYDEAIVGIPPRDKLMSGDSVLLKSRLADEIARIYEIPARKGVMGHPVHYLIRCSEEEQKNMYMPLLAALYSNDRILSKRYCMVDCDGYNHITNENMETLYKSCEFGTVILNFNCCDFDDSQYIRSEDGLLTDVCKIALKYRNRVLTVFCFPLNSEKFKNKLHTHMGSAAIIELYEDIVYANTANEYLNKLAKEHGISADEKLLIPDTEAGLFTSLELRGKFDIWYDNKLRSSLFPQYKEFENGNRKILSQKPVGSAYEELQGMIGLESIKHEIDKIINYFKAKKIFKDRSIIFSQPTMHMVFTGNPGTAKTTVARLLAQILKENEILSVGKLYEVGRADIVGKYVGQTAPLVKEAFKRAKGSVLFIDEAYSLVERDGLYGDEAINTIVQEMENNRDDTIVIFAGYPNEMNNFLDKNPGLRSRISKQIHFADYSVDELCQITKHIASQKGLFFTEEANNKLEYIFGLARRNADFGNGRFARNIVEVAQMTQIDRILRSDTECIDSQDISLITADDINIPCEIEQRKAAKIGFTA